MKRMEKIWFNLETWLPYVFWLACILNMFTGKWDRAAADAALGCLVILIPWWAEYRREKYDDKFGYGSE